MIERYDKKERILEEKNIGKCPESDIVIPFWTFYSKRLWEKD